MQLLGIFAQCRIVLLDEVPADLILGEVVAIISRRRCLGRRSVLLDRAFVLLLVVEVAISSHLGLFFAFDDD
jgi:hypothetical protein